MKTYLLLVALLVLVSCKENKPPIYKDDVSIPADTVVANKPKVNLAIIAGESIGNVWLGQNTSALVFLGPADLADAAMGKAWQTWYSKNSKLINGKSELNIYTTYKDSEMKEKVVRQIRITSSDFKTPDGLGVGSSFDVISNSFAELDLLGSFAKPGSTDTVELYDVIGSGIAFEIENTGSEKKCVAVIVHTAGKKATEEYLSFHPDLIAP